MINLLKESIKKYQKVQGLTQKIQKPSNEIRVKSKTAIALLRRDNIKEGEKLLKEAEKQIKLIDGIIKKNKNLANCGFYKEAIEEYAEAVAFYNFISKLQRFSKKKKYGCRDFLRSQKKEISGIAKIGSEEIISGICDFTGEVTRKAITIGSVENFEQLVLCKEIVECVVEELTMVGFRGKLRHKYDETERNLKKIESIIYDIKLKK